MAQSPLRYKKLIKILPKHKHAQDALLEAGFSKQTARTQAKSVLRSALKHQAREILNASPDASQKSKALMNEILGLTREELFARLRWMALENDRDVGTGLKILAPLVREHGVILSSDEDHSKVVVPVINLGFAPENMAKNIESSQEHQVLESQETKDGSVEPDNESVAQ